MSKRTVTSSDNVKHLTTGFKIGIGDEDIRQTAGEDGSGAAGSLTPYHDVHGSTIDAQFLEGSIVMQMGDLNGNPTNGVRLDVVDMKPKVENVQ